MNLTPASRRLILSLAIGLMLVAGLVAGCSNTSTPAASNDATGAKQAVAVAMTTLSTTVPDPRLLVGQTAGAITATSVPVWQFLIGNPKTDMIYAVQVENGKGQWQPYGSASLTATEWAAVPPLTAWKVDSTEAHQKAVALHTSAKSAAYMLGFVTYIPKKSGATSTPAMTWFVAFDPSQQGSAPTSTVNVDMATGAASYAK
jgi:hypothetical protein